MCIRGRQSGEELSFDELKDVLSRQSLKDHDAVLTGGEPSIHSDFVKIVKMMCRHAKTVTITTNGTFNDYLSELVGSVDNLMFQVSIDGNEECHDAIRGRGVFFKALSTIELLERNNFVYSIASVVNANNLHSMFDLRKTVETLPNLKHWKLSYEMPFGSASIDEILSIEEWNAFVDKIISSASCRLLIKKLFPFKLYDKNFDRLCAMEDAGHRFINCGSGNDKIYVYPDLKVYPCTCLTDFCVGSLKNQSLDEILSGNEIKTFSEYQIQSDSACNDCKYKRFCNGGCIGMSYRKFNRLGVGDVRCPHLAHLR